MSSHLVLGNAGFVLALMTGLWLVSIALRDVSIVDPWWSVGFAIVTVRTAIVTGWTPGKLLLVAMVSCWALRLWWHLLWRSRGKPEDPRYAAFRRRFGPERYWWLSLFQVFLLQGTLVVLISAPLQIAASAIEPDPIGITDACGLVIFVIGFVVEAVADAQLEAFRRDAANAGQVMQTGLWRYSRHPNYFGEALLWWGLWLSAIDRPYGLVSVLAPIGMTFLLLKVSGVVMLDAHLGSTKPGYADYVRRTSSFIPLPPRT